MTTPQIAGKPAVLVVDDTPENLSLMSALLRGEYTVRVANGGERALRLASESPPDLILLDVMMPEIDGYEVLRRLKENPATREIPVIFLTARTDADDERRGLELGAVDYVTKPISPAIVMARVRTHLTLKTSADFLRDKAVYLEREVARRTREIATIQDVTIMAMASLAETRDTDTGNHILRTQQYVRLLATALREHPRFSAHLDAQSIDLIYRSAPLHDIGKVGIPDRILLKPGQLSADEFAIMKRHAQLGYDAIDSAEVKLKADVDFLRIAKEIALSHHERWDGNGYPAGLRGEQIPVSARLMALADVYDALVSRRVYKEGMPHSRAAAIIREGRGTQFDPDVVDAFDAQEEAFQAIGASLPDSDDDLARKKQLFQDALNDNE